MYVCKLWKLEVNRSKSQILIFNKRGRSRTDYQWKLGECVIDVVTEYKYLGVILRPNLQFTYHLDKRCSLAKTRINDIWTPFLNNKNVDCDSKMNLFQSVVRSTITYGSQVWGFKQFENIEKLQRFFIKRFLNLPDNTHFRHILFYTQITLQIYLKCNHEIP